jgi:hypothetical protein
VPSDEPFAWYCAGIQMVGERVLDALDEIGIG